ncbi:MAG: hypothetical protein GX139_10150 [Armatimonadetes bacterium]|jgi:flagellar motor switch protein FliM|nr:hypothetical protein [Armatimonadota bacterium]
MGELLSQSEVDALLSVYKAATPVDRHSRHDKEVRLYDFARPDKFSKEHLKSLNIIHTKHGAGFAVAAAIKLRASVQATRLPVDQLAYREYCASISDGSLFVEAKLDPLTSTAIFEFNPALVSACVDLLAGGAAPSQLVSEITDIDKMVMMPIIDLVIKKYAEAWSTCVPFKPEIVSVSTDPNARQVLLQGEGVLVCGYEVTIGECVSMMSVCVPTAAVEAVLPALTVGRTLNIPGRRHDAQATSALRKAFDEVPLECRAVLGRTQLPVQDVIDLAVGDVISLPIKTTDMAEVLIEDIPAFEGVLGLSGSSRAIKIANKIGPNEVE